MPELTEGDRQDAHAGLSSSAPSLSSSDVLGKADGRVSNGSSC